MSYYFYLFCILFFFFKMFDGGFFNLKKDNSMHLYPTQVSKCQLRLHLQVVVTILFERELVQIKNVLAKQPGTKYFKCSNNVWTFCCFKVSVTAMEDSRVLLWHRDKLKLSIITDQFLQAVFDHILGRDVVKKLMQVSRHFL